MKAIITIFFTTILLFGAKIKDVANVIGVRDNQLIGYGLIVGLNGTGDGTSAKFTLRSLSNLLQTVNVKIAPQDIKSKNIAAVMVTAKLPPFSRQGDRLDLIVSSIGDAKSLEGGTLLLTPLKGLDGQIYALAQGPVTIGGMNAGGKGQANHATVGTIFGGALVEREVTYDIYNQSYANLSLKRSSFKNAISLQNEINSVFGKKVATAIDPRTIRIQKSKNESMVEFLAKVLDINVEITKEKKIVIDERTGTIVAGIDVKVEPIVVTHGGITLKIDRVKEFPKIDGKQNIQLDKDMVLGVGENSLNVKSQDITVAQVARALQRLGAIPKDIISILETMKKAGAIEAKLEII